MSKWMLVVVLALAAHFCASYLVPLDEAAKKTFGGLLGWAWPWAYGNHGPLGTVSASGFPIAGFFVAVTAAGLLGLAALAVMGVWIPAGWWRALATTGAALSLILMALFLDVTKLLPIATDTFLLIAALTERVPLTVS